MKNDEVNVNDLLFAFWPHSEYPYVLGGQITKINARGSVYSPSFQRWFRPTLIVTKSAGEQMLEELLSLRREYMEENDKVRRSFKEAFARKLPELAERLIEYSNR